MKNTNTIYTVDPIEKNTMHVVTGNRARFREIVMAALAVGACDMATSYDPDDRLYRAMIIADKQTVARIITNTK